MIVTIIRSSKYPPINDITTDVDNPPEFVNAQKLQHEPNRDMKYDKAKYADRQLKGYGPIGPIRERLEPSAAFERVRETAQQVPTWKITYSDPAKNVLEAVATSKLFHFQDDVIIVIRPTPNGESLIEMRSKSRDGIGDFGVNAKRIQPLSSIASRWPAARGKVEDRLLGRAAVTGALYCLSARIVRITAALRSSFTGFVNTIAVPIPGAHSSCSRSRMRASEPTSRVASISSLLTALIAASASRPAARIPAMSLSNPARAIMLP